MKLIVSTRAVPDRETEADAGALSRRCQQSSLTASNSRPDTFDSCHHATCVNLHKESRLPDHNRDTHICNGSWTVLLTIFLHIYPIPRNQNCAIVRSALFRPENHNSFLQACVMVSTPNATLCPSFTPTPSMAESPNVQALIDKLSLQEHPEGGYYIETDRDPLRVPNPFPSGNSHTSQDSAEADHRDSTRSASTSIYYLLTPASPKGVFHMNKGRTIHTLHKGRGRYVIIHLDKTGDGMKSRVETFVVGHDIHRGERLQWLVEGGKYKASFLLPDTRGGSESEGLLISEVCKLLRLVMLSYTVHSFLIQVNRPLSLVLNFRTTTSCQLRCFLTWYPIVKPMKCAGCSPRGHTESRLIGARC